MRALITIMTALMLFVAMPVVAGNYRKAFQLWKPLAERGNAGVQANIGGMY